MNDFNENKYKELLQHAPTLPHSEIPRALHRVKRARQRKKLVLNTIVTAAILCIVLVSTIRYSSSFAYAFAKLPGMKPLVRMIAYDKGLYDIVENEYYEEINASQTIKGNTLTITGVVADESGMVIYYKYESADDLGKIQTDPKIEVIRKGEDFDNVGIVMSWSGLNEGTFEVENSVGIVSTEHLSYENREFEFRFKAPNNAEIEFVIPFTLQKEIKQSKHIAINKELTIDQQKITVHELILSPLRSRLVLSINPNNSMEILHIGRIDLLDEKGEEWGRIGGGIVGVGSMEDEKFSLMLESNYFRVPETFKIIFDEIEAIPKGDSYVTVDWASKEILEQPNSLKLDLKVEDNYEVTYTLPKYKKNELISAFNKMIDANGKEYLSYGASMSEEEKILKVRQIFEVDTPPVNPVKLHVGRYTNYLKEKGTLKVQVK